MFSTLVLPDIEDNAPSTSEYTQLPVSEEDAAVAVVESALLKTKALSIGDKWQLLKPLIPRYMVPLCESSFGFIRFGQITHITTRLVFVYLVSFPSSALYTSFNCRGVRIHHQPRRRAYTCLPCPHIRVIAGFRTHYSFDSGLLSSLAGALSSALPYCLPFSIRPGQLVYQSTVFLSRSSISLGLPALPIRAIPIPSIIQGLLLITLSSESALGYFPESLAPGLVFFLISVEGICGGLS